MSSNKQANPMVLSSMFLALALVLPFLTGQIPQVGNAFCPMHLPVLLCGFLCGPVYGTTVGFIAPLLRTVLFGAPPLIPKGISMCLELAMYGLVSGFLYKNLPKKKINIYFSLLTAMVFGRFVWGASRYAFYRIGTSAFGWQAFFAGAVLTAIPGIILQIVVIPVIVMAVEKYAGIEAPVKRTGK